MLAGAQADTEVAKLVDRFDAANIKQFIAASVAADVLRHNEEATYRPAGARARFDGRPNASGGPLPRGDPTLLSHRLNMQISKDVDAKFCARINAAYPVILPQLMQASRPNPTFKFVKETSHASRHGLFRSFEDRRSQQIAATTLCPSVDFAGSMEAALLCLVNEMREAMLRSPSPKRCAIIRYGG